LQRINVPASIFAARVNYSGRLIVAFDKTLGITENSNCLSVL